MAFRDKQGKSLFATNAVRWPLLVAGMSGLFFLIGMSTIRETYQAWQIDQEIRDLEAQVALLEGRKSQLLDLVKKWDAPDALDLEARTRLGLRKPGERVFVIPGFEEPVTRSVNAENAKVSFVSVSNPQKWFQYFFFP